MMHDDFVIACDLYVIWVLFAPSVRTPRANFFALARFLRPFSPLNYYNHAVLAQPGCQPEISEHVSTTYRTFKPKSSQTSFQSSFASFASTRRQAS